MTAARTILIVEDDLEALGVFSRDLEHAGYRTICAMDGAQAWEAIHATPPPDAVLLDLHVPLLDGIQLVRLIRRSGSTVPVTMITADYDVSDETCTTLQALGVDIAFKPVWLEDLKALVNRMFSAGRQ